MQVSTPYRRLSSGLIQLAVWLAAAVGVPAAAQSVAGAVAAPLPAPQLKFVPNQNQWEPPVLFATDVPGGRLFFERNRLVQALYDTRQAEEAHEQGAAGAHDRINAHAYAVTFVGANPQAAVTGGAATGETNNYFLGNEPGKWARNVPAYGEVRYQDLYPGTNLRFYTHNEHLEYDFELAPGANVRRIRLRYAGQHALAVVDGALRISTTVGEVVEQSPVAYQWSGQRKVRVPCRFVLRGQEVSFTFPEGYDAARALVIDPVLDYSSFTGSAANNFGHTATYDEGGNLYAGCSVFNTGYPVTLGAYQVSFAGQTDYGVMKFNPAATGAASRVYATYIGGSGADQPHSMTVDRAYNLVILGSTQSSNFPSTSGAFDPSFNAGVDIVVTKLSADGRQLLASTFLGGSGIDGQTPMVLSRNHDDAYRGDVTTDAQGNVYLASSSTSPDFPAQGGFQLAKAGLADAVIVKLNPGLSVLVWSSFLGGSRDDAAYSVLVDSTGTAFVSGGTASPDLPGRTGGLNPGYRGGVSDGFVARIAPPGNALVRSSYIGTSGYDQAYFVQLNRQGDVYLYGQTDGAYPVSPDVYFNPNGRQFVHKLNRALTASIFSTVIGNGAGSVNISPTAFQVDNCGQILLAGWGGDLITGAVIANMPVTPNAILQAAGFGSYHYIMQLSTDARQLVYGTYFGNPTSHGHGGTSRFDKRGILYASVCVNSSAGNLTTPGAWAVTKGSGNFNNLALKLDLLLLNANFTPSTTPGGAHSPRGCAPLTVYFTRPSITGSSTSWDFGNGQTSTSTAAQVSTTYATPGRYLARLTVADPTNCLQRVTATDTIEVLAPPLAAAGPDRSICQGSAVSLTAADAGAGVSYTWSPSTGLNTDRGRTVVASPAVSTRYTLTATSANGCSTTATVLVNVLAQPRAAAGPDQTICQGSSTTLTAADAGVGADVTYSWSPSTGLSTTLGRSVTAAPAVSTRYILTTTAASGCSSTDTLEVQVSPLPRVVTEPSRSICPGGAITLTAVDANAAPGAVYAWAPSTGLNTTQGATVTAAPAVTTTYVVTATAPGGCSSSATVVVSVADRPQVSIAASAPNIFTGAPVVFANTTTGGPASYSWSFGDGATSAERAPSHAYGVEGDYTVRLVTRYGPGGQCEEISSLPLSVREFALPNVITPNGDGKNETFKPFVAFEPVDITIFNRWGKQVFAQTNYVDGWGRDNVPGGLYYYRLTTAAGLTWKGWLEVIR